MQDAEQGSSALFPSETYTLALRLARPSKANWSARSAASVEAAALTLLLTHKVWRKTARCRLMRLSRLQLMVKCSAAVLDGSARSVRACVAQQRQAKRSRQRVLSLKAAEPKRRKKMRGSVDACACPSSLYASCRLKTHANKLPCERGRNTFTSRAAGKVGLTGYSPLSRV